MLHLFGMGLRSILILGLWTALIVAVAVASCGPATAPTPGLPRLVVSPIGAPDSTPPPPAVDIPETEPTQEAGVSGSMEPGGNPEKPSQSNQLAAEQPDSSASRELSAPGLAPPPTPLPLTPTTPPLPTATQPPSPIPTATVQPTATPLPTATPPPTATPLPTAAPLPPQTPTPTAQPTATPQATATPLPPPTAAPLPTATPLPPPQQGCSAGQVDVNSAPAEELDRIKHIGPEGRGRCFCSALSPPWMT